MDNFYTVILNVALGVMIVGAWLCAADEPVFPVSGKRKKRNNL